MPRRIVNLALIATLALGLTACGGCANTHPGATVSKAISPLGAFYAAQAEYTIALRTFIQVVQPVEHRSEIKRVVSVVAEFDELHARPIIMATNEAILIAADSEGNISQEYINNILFSLANKVPSGTPSRVILDSLLAAMQARQMPDANVLSSVNAFLMTGERLVRTNILAAQSAGSDS